MIGVDGMVEREPLSLNEIQTEELRLLKAFDETCRRYGIHYYVAYGTLLGAIREGGPIPWDDDTDVLVCREDYDKLLGIRDCPEGCELLLPGGEDNPWSWAKWISTTTRFIEPNVRHTSSYGVFIDVFPLDFVNARRSRRRFYYVRRLQQVRNYAYFMNHDVAPGNKLKKTARRAIGAVGRIFSLRKFDVMIDAAIRTRGGSEQRHCVNFFSPYSFEKELLPCTQLQGDNVCSYSGYEFETFSDPVAYLEHLYGSDWRTPVHHTEHDHGYAYWLKKANEVTYQLESAGGCDD